MHRSYEDDMKTPVERCLPLFVTKAFAQAKDPVSVSEEAVVCEKFLKTSLYAESNPVYLEDKKESFDNIRLRDSYKELRRQMRVIAQYIFLWCDQQKIKDNRNVEIAKNWLDLAGGMSLADEKSMPTGVVVSSDMREKVFDPELVKTQAEVFKLFNATKRRFEWVCFYLQSDVATLKEKRDILTDLTRGVGMCITGSLGDAERAISEFKQRGGTIALSQLKRSCVEALVSQYVSSVLKFGYQPDQELWIKHVVNYIYNLVMRHLDLGLEPDFADQYLERVHRSSVGFYVNKLQYNGRGPDQKFEKPVEYIYKLFMPYFIRSISEEALNFVRRHDASMVLVDVTKEGDTDVLNSACQSVLKSGNVLFRVKVKSSESGIEFVGVEEIHPDKRGIDFNSEKAKSSQKNALKRIKNIFKKNHGTVMGKLKSSLEEELLGVYFYSDQWRSQTEGLKEYLLSRVCFSPEELDRLDAKLYTGEKCGGLVVDDEKLAGRVLTSTVIKCLLDAKYLDEKEFFSKRNPNVFFVEVDGDKLTFLKTDYGLVLYGSPDDFYDSLKEEKDAKTRLKQLCQNKNFMLAFIEDYLSGNVPDFSVNLSSILMTPSVDFNAKNLDVHFHRRFFDVLSKEEKQSQSAKSFFRPIFDEFTSVVLDACSPDCCLILKLMKNNKLNDRHFESLFSFICDVLFEKNLSDTQKFFWAHKAEFFDFCANFLIKRLWPNEFKELFFNSYSGILLAAGFYDVLLKKISCLSADERVRIGDDVWFNLFNTVRKSTRSDLCEKLFSLGVLDFSHYHAGKDNIFCLREVDLDFVDGKNGELTLLILKGKFYVFSGKTWVNNFYRLEDQLKNPKALLLSYISNPRIPKQFGFEAFLDQHFPKFPLAKIVCLPSDKWTLNFCSEFSKKLLFELKKIYQTFYREKKLNTVESGYLNKVRLSFIFGLFAQVEKDPDNNQYDKIIWQLIGGGAFIAIFPDHLKWTFYNRFRSCSAELSEKRVRAIVDFGIESIIRSLDELDPRDEKSRHKLLGCATAGLGFKLFKALYVRKQSRLSSNLPDDHACEIFFQNVLDLFASEKIYLDNFSEFILYNELLKIINEDLDFNYLKNNQALVPGCYFFKKKIELKKSGKKCFAQMVFLEDKFILLEDKFVLLDKNLQDDNLEDALKNPEGFLKSFFDQFDSYVATNLFKNSAQSRFLEMHFSKSFHRYYFEKMAYRWIESPKSIPFLKNKTLRKDDFECMFNIMESKNVSRGCWLNLLKFFVLYPRNAFTDDANKELVLFYRDKVFKKFISLPASVEDFKIRITLGKKMEKFLSEKLAPAVFTEIKNALSPRSRKRKSPSSSSSSPESKPVERQPLGRSSLSNSPRKIRRIHSFSEGSSVPLPDRVLFFGGARKRKSPPVTEDSSSMSVSQSSSSAFFGRNQLSSSSSSSPPSSSSSLLSSPNKKRKISPHPG